jgi:ABC-type multidrug transport system ATPase subunit
MDHPTLTPHTQYTIHIISGTKSGLGSLASTQLMELLQKVAQGGSAVLFTIHQPSSETFFAFDKVILLQEGRVKYSSETKLVV